MKNLLVVAVLGLLLGLGLWKAQNPDGTVEDFRSQADTLVERLSSGVQAVRSSPQDPTETTALQAFEDRLSLLETAAMDAPEQGSGSDTSDAQDEQISASAQRLDSIDGRLELLMSELEENDNDEDMLAVNQSLQDLGSRVDALRDEISSRQQGLEEQLDSTREQVSTLKLRLDTLGSTEAAAQGEPSDADAASAPASLAASLDERFTALESRLATVNSDSRRIAALSDQLQAARDDIGDLRNTTDSRFGELDESLVALQAVEPAPSSDDIQGLIREQLAQLQASADNAANDNDGDGDTDQMQSSLDDTLARVSELEARLGELSSSSATASDSASTPSSSSTDNTDDSSNAAAANLPRSADDAPTVDYKIYFDRDSVDISDAAAGVLDSFIAQEKNRTTGVTIYGFTDSLGPAIYNQQLALQRATNVRNYLISNGFDFNKITALNGLSAEAATEILPDNADSAQQRVVVLFASQP